MASTNEVTESSVMKLTKKTPWNYTPPGNIKGSKQICQNKQIQVSLNNQVANRSFPVREKTKGYTQMIKFMESHPLKLAFFEDILIIPEFLAEFWYTCSLREDGRSFTGTILQGSRRISIDQSDIRIVLGLPVSTNFTEIPKKSEYNQIFSKIGYTVQADGRISTKCFTNKWRFLVVTINRCLTHKAGSSDILNHFGKLILSSMIDGLDFNYAKLYFEEFVRLLKEPSKCNQVPFIRLLSLILRYKLGKKQYDEFLESKITRRIDSMDKSVFHDIDDKECKLTKHMNKWIKNPYKVPVVNESPLEIRTYDEDEADKTVEGVAHALLTMGDVGDDSQDVGVVNTEMTNENDDEEVADQNEKMILINAAITNENYQEETVAIDIEKQPSEDLFHVPIDKEDDIVEDQINPSGAKKTDPNVFTLISNLEKKIDILINDVQSVKNDIKDATNEITGLKEKVLQIEKKNSGDEIVLRTSFTDVNQKIELLESKCKIIDDVHNKVLDVEVDVGNLKNDMEKMKTGCSSKTEKTNNDFVDSTKYDPAKKLVVLDINGLLAKIEYCKQSIKNEDYRIGKHSVFKRPYCEQFLNFCFSKFNVGIWTSREEYNMKPIVSYLMTNNENRFIFCWDQTKCAKKVRKDHVDKDKRFLFFKQLDLLWDNCENKLPWKPREYNETNTLLIDDSPTKAILNPKYTAVFPYTYNRNDKQDNGIDPDGEFCKYLDSLAVADDVQKFIQHNPFGQLPIDQEHRDWDFFADIIKEFKGNSSDEQEMVVCQKELTATDNVHKRKRNKSTIDEQRLSPRKQIKKGGSFKEFYYKEENALISGSESVLIQKEDFELLKPRAYLNDTIVDFYILYLKNKLKAEDLQRIHVFNSHFFVKLIGHECKDLTKFEVQEGFKRVKNWTKKLTLFEKDFIIMPVVFKKHWSIVVICHLPQLKYGKLVKDPSKVPCILHMNPMIGSHEVIGDIVKSYLLEEWMQRTTKVEDNLYSKIKRLEVFSPRLPQQPNLHDCALFILHYVELFLNQSPMEINPLNFSLEDDSTGFLSKNWFKEEDAVEKRSFIKNLICELQETYFSV